MLRNIGRNPRVNPYPRAASILTTRLSIYRYNNTFLLVTERAAVRVPNAAMMTLADV